MEEMVLGVPFIIAPLMMRNHAYWSPETLSMVTLAWRGSNLNAIASVVIPPDASSLTTTFK